MKKLYTFAAFVLAIAVLTAPGFASTPTKLGAGPRVVELHYYEDFEDGRHHNVTARVKGRADRVSARIGGVRTEGRLSSSIGFAGRGKAWFFRDRRFVKKLRRTLAATGAAEVAVRAARDGLVKHKRCTLVLEHDPLYGYSAGGECRRA